MRTLVKTNKQLCKQYLTKWCCSGNIPYIYSTNIFRDIYGVHLPQNIPNSVMVVAVVHGVGMQPPFLSTNYIITITLLLLYHHLLCRGILKGSVSRDFFFSILSTN